MIYVEEGPRPGSRNKGVRMELVNQPLDGQIGQKIIDLLESGEYDKANFVVAFAQSAGVQSLKEALSRFRASGGDVKICVGIDLGGTSKEALVELLKVSDELSIFHSVTPQTFHPKIYYLQGQTQQRMIIGSSNLTSGGLWTNVESSVIVDLSGDSDTSVNARDRLSGYFNKLADAGLSYRILRNHSDIQELVDSGYVLDEVDARQSQRDARGRQRKQGDVRFGTGFAAKPPRKNRQQPGSPQRVNPEPADLPLELASVASEAPILWYYTEKITGGSGNQVDLSKKCLLEDGYDAAETPFDRAASGAGKANKYMAGTVEFFGVKPEATSSRKILTLAYRGDSYEGNALLFPSGGKRPNGTWRLQLNGINSSGLSLTTAIRNDGGLAPKIIAFTEIEDDYFSISLFDENLKDNFESRSTLLGWNGPSRKSRRVGIILPQSKESSI